MRVCALLFARERVRLRTRWAGVTLLVASSLLVGNAYAQREGTDTSGLCEAQAGANDSLSTEKIDACLQGLLVDEGQAVLSGWDKRMARAAERYRQIIRRAGPALSESAASVVRRHVAQVEGSVPGAVFQNIVEQERGSPPDDWTFREGAGEALLAWWRRQDPVLATARN